MGNFQKIFFSEIWKHLVMFCRESKVFSRKVWHELQESV